MKKITAFLIAICLFNICTAQSIGISNDGSQPNPSAILDLKSSSKGILLPRVSLTSPTDSITIQHPEKSLLVYNINPQLENGVGFYAWAGDRWELIANVGQKFIKGKNKFITTVDSVTRNYWVHVPTEYDSQEPTPVVFMLHGASGTGERFYDMSGWKELGEQENFISVFPTARAYRYIEDSMIKHTTTWNVWPDMEEHLMPGQNMKDDVRFFKKILIELTQKFNIDTNRIYMDGFSSGGQMAAKCSIEMSDIFAAIAGNAGSFVIDTTYIPKRKLPVLFQVGNEDYGSGKTGEPVPLRLFDSTLHRPTSRNYHISQAHIRNLGLDSIYILSGDTNIAMIADYKGISGDTLNVFKYVFVKDLGHKYPNGDNHWMEAAVQHWAWFRKYRKP